MMKKVLVLGAGMVAGAHVRYLLEQPDLHVTVASRTVSKAEEIVKGHPRGEARAVDITDESALEGLIKEHDLSVSLLPWAYHPIVARYCVKHGRHMVTTSYVKDAMAELDEAAKAAGVLLLNEVGVDPGIDHMTAMRVILKVQGDGGRIASFTSWCGGLPAPEANDNPYGYKFSWSPRGVLLAGKNTALFMKDKEEVFVPGDELFQNRWPVPVVIEGVLTDLEGYPNRDSLPYMETYGITDTDTMFRGTLRNPGWCEIMSHVLELGYLGEDDLGTFAGQTYASFTAGLVGPAAAGKSGGALAEAVAAHLGLAADSYVIAALSWLGLFGDEPVAAKKGAAVDVLTSRMLEKMSYRPEERDMLVLQHQFLAEYPDRHERIVSTMIDFGIPNGDSSMSRTVGLPAAIAVKLVLAGKIDVTGVHIPVIPEIYEPILTELEGMGIHFSEEWGTARPA
jgi:saccharopine dehydrogenase-like NADP-dependent oxidoreductase